MGCGILESIQVKTNRGIIKKTPETNGIKFSDTPLRSKNEPTDLQNPSARIKLAHKKPSNASVYLRPSKKPITKPNTIPNDKPLKNNIMQFNGTGKRAKPNKEICENPIKTRITTDLPC